MKTKRVKISGKFTSLPAAQNFCDLARNYPKYKNVSPEEIKGHDDL